MKKYRITEVVVYEVEAEDSLDAYERVFNTDGGLIQHFHEVPERSISEFNSDTGCWLDIEEPEPWDA